MFQTNHLHLLYLARQKTRTGATFFLTIRNTWVTIELVGHFPSPILISGNGHLRPPVNSYIMLPHLPVCQETCNDGVTRLMATPHSVIRVGGLTPVWVKVPSHWWARPFPKRIQITPISRGQLIDANKISNLVKVKLPSMIPKIFLHDSGTFAIHNRQGVSIQLWQPLDLGDTRYMCFASP